METVKDFLNFCNTAMFYDYKNERITCELNQVRKCLVNTFYKTIPHSRVLVCLSIVDDKSLKTHFNDIEIILENIHDLKQKVLNKISFQKLVRDEQQRVLEPILNDDDEQKTFHRK